MKNNIALVVDDAVYRALSLQICAGNTMFVYFVLVEALPLSWSQPDTIYTIYLIICTSTKAPHPNYDWHKRDPRVPKLRQKKVTTSSAGLRSQSPSGTSRKVSTGLQIVRCKMLLPPEDIARRTTGKHLDFQSSSSQCLDFPT